MTLETAKFLCSWKAHDPQETSPRSLSRTMNSSSSVHGGGKRRVGEHAAFLAACMRSTPIADIYYIDAFTIGPAMREGVSLLH